MITDEIKANFNSVVRVHTPDRMNKIVATKSGPVRGILKKTADNFAYYLFQGIPYEQPPVGKFKFKDPRPLTTPWKEVLDCTKPGPGSYEYLLFRNNKVIGQEDSMHVNIFTPEVSEFCLIFMIQYSYHPVQIK